MIIANDLNN